MAEAGFDSIDAAVNWGNGKAYFFRAGQYVRYDITTDRVDPGYPLPIAGHWPGLSEAGFDAPDAVWVKLPVSGEVGPRPDVGQAGTNQMAAAGLRPITGTGRARGGGIRLIDAAVNWGNRKAYFFRAGQYVRYDITTDRVDPGYPLPIAGNWPGLAEAGFDSIDAAVNWGNGKAYFFRAGHYVRYDITADRVDTDSVARRAWRTAPVPRSRTGRRNTARPIPRNLPHRISPGERGGEARGYVKTVQRSAWVLEHYRRQLRRPCSTAVQRSPHRSCRTRNVPRGIKWILRWCGSSPR